jgi:hypothetical protein
MLASISIMSNELLVINGSVRFGFLVHFQKLLKPSLRVANAQQ